MRERHESSLRAFLWLLTDLWLQGAVAQSPSQPSPSKNGVSPPDDPALENPGGAPSLELLEFLGEWETPDGEWLDPVDLGAALGATPEDASGETR